VRADRQLTTVRVDRVACTGHGVCRALAPREVPLDEWGYPVPSQVAIEAAAADALVRLCPAAALLRTRADRG